MILSDAVLRCPKLIRRLPIPVLRVSSVFGQEEQVLEEARRSEGGVAAEGEETAMGGDVQPAVAEVEEQLERELSPAVAATLAVDSAVNKQRTRVKQRTWRMDRHQRRRLQASARSNTCRCFCR